MRRLHRFLPLLPLLPSLLVATSLSACGAGAPSDSSAPAPSEALTLAPTAVQMNDVSILFPLATSADDLDAYLSPTSAGMGGDLLPASTLDFVAAKVAGVNAKLDTTSLHAIAFRLDPCFAQIGPVTDASTCAHQLRIIFQSLNVGTGDGDDDGGSVPSITAQDAGVHAFYSLTQDQFDALLEGILALRQANAASAASTDLGPLAVHPILAKQGLSGAMATGLNALALQYAGKATLTRVTAFLGVFAQHTSWNFAAVDLVNGRPEVSPIAGLAAGTFGESVNLGTAPAGLISLSFATPTTKDVVAPLVSSTVQDATSDVRQAAFDSALRIESPDFNSPNTIDCASCHVAEIGRQLVGEDFFKMKTTGDANLFTPDTRYVPAKDLKVKFPARPPEGLSANLHAFSYDGTQPMIVQRVINETAAVVALVSAGPLALE